MQRKRLGVWGARCGALLVTLAAGARAQGTVPGPPPGSAAPAPAATAAPAQAFPPVAPEQSPAPPAQSAYPAGQYEATQPAPYGAPPPPAYGAPPPQWPAPQPYYAPPTPPAPENAPAERSLAVRGPYFGAVLGAGGPFGGDTTRLSGGYSEGVGVLAAAGYAFIPNFGVNLFLHYNHSSLSVPHDLQLDENSGHVLLYGIEARGIIGTGPLVGWASLGVSLGSGSVGLSTHQGEGLSGTVTSRNDATIDFNPMPVLGFGAEVRLVEGLSVGPQLRWYLTSAHQACETPQFSGLPANADFATSKTCAKTLDTLTVPDIVFIGIGVSYRLALGK